MNVETRSRMRSLLDDLVRSRSREGEFDWAVIVPDVKTILKREIREDSMLEDELLDDLARTLTRDYVSNNTPPIPSDLAQLALFYDADALLTLGDREVIRMADARARHLEQYRTVLTRNFESQSNAYFGRMAYIDDRLGPLRDLGCTLAEVEHGVTERAA